MPLTIDVIILAVFGLFWLGGSPLLLIWAVNTLFALAIPYTLATWAATWVLLAVPLLLLQWPASKSIAPEGLS